MEFSAWLKTGIIWQIWSQEVPTESSYFGIYLRGRHCFRLTLTTSSWEGCLLRITTLYPLTPSLCQLAMTKRSIYGLWTNWSSNTKRSLMRRAVLTLEQWKTTKRGLHIWAKGCCTGLTIVMLMTCLWQLELWYSCGITKDQRLCKLSSGALIPSPKSNSTLLR